MHENIWRQLQDMGDEFSPKVIERTRQLLAPLALAPHEAGAVVVRDLTYGTQERQRLDVFKAPDAVGSPVVMFVHGGGFAAGDKGGAEAPFYNNVGAWAVRSGFVGVNMTYRLAPEYGWPAGAVDVAAALAWLRTNAARHGGDANRIVVIGNSAGAAHLAGCLAGHAATGCSVAGAVFLSGIYEPDAFHANPMHEVYFGRDRASYADRSAVLGLVAARVPCLFAISQFDPPQFQRQLAAVFEAHTATRGHCPETLHLQGHNHFSPAMHLGSSLDTLGANLAAFVRRVCG